MIGEFSPRGTLPSGEKPAHGVKQTPWALTPFWRYVPCPKLPRIRALSMPRPRSNRPPSSVPSSRPRCWKQAKKELGLVVKALQERQPRKRRVPVPGRPARPAVHQPLPQGRQGPVVRHGRAGARPVLVAGQERGRQPDPPDLRGHQPAARRDRPAAVQRQGQGARTSGPRWWTACRPWATSTRRGRSSWSASRTAPRSAGCCCRASRRSARRCTRTPWPRG